MQQHIHTIVKYFFQKDTLQEVPEQVLQQFTEDHPYSSIGHWLLAKKVHDTAPDRAAAQSASAAAWFNNPLWMHWTLQEHEPVAETLLIPAPKEEPVTARTTVPPVQQEPEPSIVPAIEPEAVTEAETTSTVLETTTPEAIIAEPVAEETEPTETEILIPGVAEPVSLIEETPPVQEPVTEPEPVSAPEPEITVPEQETAAPAAPVEQVVQTPATPATPALDLLPGSFKLAISDSEEPVFEPYHTIDYFASLGIKLRQEDMKDKLGKQLKSFTEWLRSMKRIAPVQSEEIPNAFDETLQQSIQESAGHSVEGKEVVTEAMAEVWVKQGSKQKAIAIYEKLSLLNPAKSPYFAARIDQIKAL